LHSVQRVADQVMLAIADWLAPVGTDGCVQTVLAQMADRQSTQPVDVGVEEEPPAPVAHSSLVSLNCCCHSPRRSLLLCEILEQTVPHCAAGGKEVMVGCNGIGHALVQNQL